MPTLARSSAETLGRIIILGLSVMLIVLFVAAFGGERTKAQGSYEWVQTVDEMWDVSAPCFNSGNCNFSCGPATAGNSCYANICTGNGNGDTAYLNHSEYTCTYFPPPSCAAGQIGTYPDCRFPTCADDPTLDGCPCSATNACGESNGGSYSGGSCGATAPPLTAGYGNACSVSNSCGASTNYGSIQCNGSCSASAPSEDSCNACVPDYSCAASTCSGSTCSDGCGGSVNGTLTGGSCDTCTPDYSCAASTCSGSTCSDGCGGSVNGTLTGGSCGGGGGGGVSASLTADDTDLIAGESTMLRWSSSGATSCLGSGFSTGGAISGAVSVSPPTTSSYTAQCTDGTNTDTAGVTINVSAGSCTSPYSASISVSPSRIQAGEDAVLTWSASNVSAASCTVTNLNTNTQIDSAAVSGCGVAERTYPLNDILGQTTYRLECGSLRQDVVVNLVPRFEEF